MLCVDCCGFLCVVRCILFDVRWQWFVVVSGCWLLMCVVRWCLIVVQGVSLLIAVVCCALSVAVFVSSWLLLVVCGALFVVSCYLLRVL